MAASKDLSSLSNETTVCITYNPRQKYHFKMYDGHRSVGETTQLSIEAIKEIVALHEIGVFQQMIDNNSMELSVVIPASVPTSVSVSASMPTPSKPTSISAPTVPPTSPTPSEGSSSSTSSTSSGGLQLWQTYLKLFRAQHPELTYAQAQQQAKISYPVWKASQQ
jgi:hypothetical protein